MDNGWGTVFASIAAGVVIVGLICAGSCAQAKNDAIPRCYFFDKPNGQSLEFHGEVNAYRRSISVFDDLCRLQFQDGAVVDYNGSVLKIKTEHCQKCNSK